MLTTLSCIYPSRIILLSQRHITPDASRHGIKEIRLWMSQNFLKLNENKTEFIVFGTTVQLSKLKSSTLAVGDSSVNLSSKVRNLGAIFDNKMKLISHVNTVCQKAHNQLRNIGKIQEYLSQDTK